jgi:hypothetical protein
MQLDVPLVSSTLENAHLENGNARPERELRIPTGALLIALPVLFTLFYTLLQIAFDYPAILRQPAPEVLRQFQPGGPMLVAFWYGFALTSLLFLPSAVLLERTLRRTNLSYLILATPLAIVATLVQVLGLLRWPFLVPELAQTVNNPATDAATRAATLAVFEAFHRYLGVAVGEHMGYLFTAAWTAVICLAFRHSARFPRWLSWTGLVAALGIAIGLLEPLGISAAGMVNALSYILWSLWLIAVGVTVLRRPEAATVRSARWAENSVGSGETPAGVSLGSTL